MLPVVFHDAYVARDVPAGHRFPMGKFRADMKVSLTNDGPVTIWIDSAEK